MKNTIFGVGIALAIAGLYWSCEKDEIKVILTPGTTPVVAVQLNNVVLESANATDSLSLFSWTPSDFGFDEAVKYTVQLSKPGTNFATGSTLRNVVMPANRLEFKYTVANLNTAGKNVAGIAAGTEGPIEVRVKAEVTSLAAVPTVDPVYSDVFTLYVTPY